MVTKSISLNEDEAAELEQYVEVSGEDEADALRRLLDSGTGSAE